MKPRVYWHGISVWSSYHRLKVVLFSVLRSPLLPQRGGRRGEIENLASRSGCLHMITRGTFAMPCGLSQLIENWRRKRDSNPRTSFPVNGFQDRRLQPLGHSSALMVAFRRRLRRVFSAPSGCVRRPRGPHAALKLPAVPEGAAARCCPWRSRRCAGSPSTSDGSRRCL